MFTPLPFVCGGYCTGTVTLEVENAAQWRAILSSTVSCRSRRLTRQRVTLLLCLYLRCKDAALPTRLRTSHAVTASHEFMARSLETGRSSFLNTYLIFIYSLFVCIFGIFARNSATQMLPFMLPSLRTDIRLNGFAKRIVYGHQWKHFVKIFLGTVILCCWKGGPSVRRLRNRVPRVPRRRHLRTEPHKWT